MRMSDQGVIATGEHDFGGSCVGQGVRHGHRGRETWRCCASGLGCGFYQD